LEVLAAADRPIIGNSITDSIPYPVMQAAHPTPRVPPILAILFRTGQERTSRRRVFLPPFFAPLEHGTLCFPYLSDLTDGERASNEPAQGIGVPPAHPERDFPGRARGRRTEHSVWVIPHVWAAERVPVGQLEPQAAHANASAAELRDPCLQGRLLGRVRR